MREAVREKVDLEHEYRILLPDGTVRHVQATCHPVLNGAGNVVEVLGTVRDVTERKQAEHALREAQAALAHVTRVTTLGEVTASIAHEVNQPLLGIVSSASSCSRWLAAQPPNLQRAQRALERIMKAGTRASAVIDRVRTLVKRQPLRAEPVDLNEIVRDVIAMVRHELQRSGVSLKTRLAEAVPAVPGDRVQLQQVVLNLILNAIDATREIEGRPRQVLVDVTLRGWQERARGGPRLGRRARSGFAGPSVRGVLHDEAEWTRHGALDLQVDRRSAWRQDQRDTQFPSRRDLPVLAAPRVRRHGRRITTLPMPAPSEQPIVFVVDDDALVRDTIEDLLQSVGLDVRLFASPGEFLKTRRPDAPGCLVLDVRLPEQSGLDFQKALVGTDMELPIVFITGHGDIPMTVRAMKSGAVEFLTKPFRDQDLIDAIQAAIARDRARRADARVLVELRRRFAALTPREQDVMRQVVSGRLNKQVAGDLNLSEARVKALRGQVMRKMQAETLPELVRMADRLGITAANQAPPPK